MHLAAFMIAGPVIHSHAVWRHPRTTGDFLRPELYQDIARILERARFDLAFFADRLAMADTYGASGDGRDVWRSGCRPTRPDPGSGHGDDSPR
jgi:alkanesulfonate monooxygenase SsuD/methylene tetrahydromethanopterin reductase-like flavin-dependent oxidoreductase (luciferase family)